jgi:alpha-L-glutamate ligase-like protein/uncharacterized protein (TIGR02421 family)
MAFADNKLKTKAFLAARGIPTAKIYARIETRDQLREFDFSKLPNDCVLKPNYGFGGEGILILKGRDRQGHFLQGGRSPMTTKKLREHCEDILDGMFSVNGKRDTAFFEQILLPHECFARFRPIGLPDIRVIVFNLVPVMAMLRIPTAQSQGKANVHLGGIGIGIDLAKGVTTHAAQYHSIITKLPHGSSPSGIQIPYWDEILLISSRIQHATNIGYLACDITIDEQMGPTLLEVNARAGLMVQLANLAPLQARLERVKGVKVGTPEKGVRMGQDLFGMGKSKDGTGKQQSSNKPILGTHEVISIAGDGANIEAPCIIAPDQERTIFSETLLEQVQEKGGVELEDEKEQTFRVKFSLAGKKMQTLIAIGPVPGNERAIIGRRDLTGFLIDPAKNTPTHMRRESVKADVRAVDNTLAQIDRDLLLLKHIKPINYEEERRQLESDTLYNPTFQYAKPAANLDEVERKIEKPIIDTSPMGILLEKKRQELLTRVALIRHRGDADRFTQASRALFGAPTSALMHMASAEIQKRVACEIPVPADDLLTAEDAQKIFKKALDTYSLHDWQISIRPKIVADCTVGGGRLYIREAAKFSKVQLDALIAHEIETHVLTAENGSYQPYAIFRNGCANYLDTQEGLAMYNQNRIYGPYHEKRYNPPRNLLGVAFALDHSFAETRRYLQDELGYDPAKALSGTISIKRGLGDTSEPGGFTKSVVYYRGLRAVEQFVEDGRDLRSLYIGKIAIEDLDLIKKIADLEPPLLLPHFLLDTESTQKTEEKERKKKNERKAKKRKNEKQYEVDAIQEE